MMNHGVGGTFDRTAADGQPLPSELILAQLFLAGAKVLGGLACQRRVRLLFQMQSLQRHYQVRHAPLPEHVELSRGSVRGGRVFAIHVMRDRPHVLGRVRPIENVQGVGKVQVDHTFDPGRAIVRGGQPGAMVQPAPPRSHFALAAGL